MLAKSRGEKTHQHDCLLEFGDACESDVYTLSTPDLVKNSDCVGLSPLVTILVTFAVTCTVTVTVRAFVPLY